MRLEFRHSILDALVTLTTVAFVCAALAPPALAGPSGSWQLLSPPTQSGGAAVYASSTQMMYVLGGDGTSNLHAVPVNGPPAEWQVVATAGTPPAARFGHSLLYDATNDRLLVFGGQDYNGHSYNDLWQLTLGSTPTWSRITTGGSNPAPRSNFGACFDDARGILVVFGGVDSLGDLLPNHLYQIDLGQPSPEWSEWIPDGSTASARSGLTLSDDPAHDGLVLFGGNDGSADQNDAYTMSYGSHAWTQIAAGGDVPPPTTRHLGAFDGDDDVLLVWGGTGGDDEVRSLSLTTNQWTIEPNTNWQPGPVGHTHPVGAWVAGQSQFLALDGDSNNQLFDFYYYPPGGSYWQDWQDPGVSGELRYGCTFVYDRADAMALLFGGDDFYGNAMNTSWTYSLSGQKGWYDTFFHGLAGNYTPGITRHCAVWDQKHRRMLVFGGMNQGYQQLNSVYAWNDTLSDWNYWTQLSPTGTPPSPRYGAAAIYDPVGDRMIVFGGLDAGGYGRRDLWQLSLTPSPAWTRLVVPGGPSGREDHTAIYDEPRHRMIVFGGSDSSTGGLLNDVWALSLPGLTWTQLLPTGTPAPGRYQHTAVLDTRRDRMLVYGGTVDFGADARDTWALDLAPATPVWSHLTPNVATMGQPIGRYQQAAVYDSIGDRMLVYGGLMPPISIFGTPYPLKDLWGLQFDFSSGTTAVGPGAPVAVFSVGLPYPNPARGTTRLAYTLPHEGRVRAAIYDLAGRRVAGLEDGVRPAGPHELAWSGRDAQGRAVLPGLYFYRLEAGGRTVTQKVMQVR